MSTTVHRIEERDVPTVPDIGTHARVIRFLAIAVALAGVAVAVAGAADHNRRMVTAAAVLVSAFAAATVVVAFARPRELMWVWLAIGTMTGALALASDALVGVVPLVAAAAVVALPDGIVAETRAPGRARPDRARRAFPCAIVVGAADHPPRGLLLVESPALAVIAVIAFAFRLSPCGRGRAGTACSGSVGGPWSPARARSSSG